MANDTSIDMDALVASVETEVGTFNAQNVWEVRDEDHEAEQNRFKEFEKLTDEEREVVRDVVSKGLSEIHDRIDEWLPYGLDIDRGRWVKVNFRLLFSDLEDEIKHQVEVSERKINESAEQLAEVLESDEA